MITFNLIKKLCAALRRPDSTAIVPQRHEDSDLKRILAAEEWLQQQPRTSFEIARHLFGVGHQTISDIDIAIHDMALPLYEAGYTTLNSDDSELADCVWVKA